MENPTLICTTCRHADRGGAMWPCRSCSRINTLEDYYEPADGENAPSHGDEIRALGDNALARFLRDKLKIACGNCPAEALCIASGRTRGGEECLNTITEWLKQEAAK